MISPTTPRCTPSGLTMMNDRSVFAAMIVESYVHLRDKTG